MKFTKTPLEDVYVIELEERNDERGFFSRAFCVKEFEAMGLQHAILQSNISFNTYKGTLRGMHYQVGPATEVKLVRCTSGAIYDVIVDLRPASKTYLSHFGIELSSENRKTLYVPEMFAHGYITLTDNAEIFYQVSANYTPECERGLRYNDPSIGIKWPTDILHISDKDNNWPLLGISN